jgi:hypothetical protein
MIARTLVVLALVAVVAVPATAQPDEFALAAWDAGAAAHVLVRVKSTGAASTLATLPPFTPYQVLHAADNQGFRIIGQTAAPGYPGAVLHVDPKGRVTTVVTSNLLQAAALMIHDPDGGELIATRAPNLDTLLVRLQAGVLSTVATVKNLAIDGFTADPDTGLLLARGFINSPLQFGYFRVDRKTGAVVTFTLPPVWNIRNMGVGSRRPAYRAKHGDFTDLFVSGQNLVGAVVSVD